MVSWLWTQGSGSEGQLALSGGISPPSADVTRHRSILCQAMGSLAGHHPHCPTGLRTAPGYLEKKMETNGKLLDT